MAATMDPAPAIPDAQMEADDIPFPCKGCGEILEEGKAFELAGNRWHIDCFRCHTCGTLLDSDAHLLLLGDGSLICQNCTYSCSACGNKIEDTAILTGDQAFCSNCFRCRNCKRRIENLRYARTSQGIFCMDCHETLMQRRRKKKAAAAAKKPAHLDKSLPSLPFEEPELPPVAHDPSKHHHGRDGVPDTTSRSHSPERRVPPPQPTHPAPSPPVRQPDNSADTMILPSTTYRPHRESDASNKSEPDALDEYLISVRYDGEDEATAQIAPADPNLLKNREQLSSFNHAPQRSPPPPPPHGPPQEGGRAPTDHDGIPQVAELPANEWRPHDKLQDRRAKEETPRSESRESGSRPSSPHVRSNVHPDSLKSSATPQKPAGTAPGSTSSSTRPSGDLHRLHEYGSTDSSRSLSSAPQYPRRGDSLEQSVTNHVLQKDSSEAHGVNKPQTAPSSGTRKEDATEPSKTSADVAQQSPRPTTSHARRGSTTTLHSDPGRDAGPTLSPLRYNATGGELSMDDDLARILGSDTSRDTKEGSGESFFKRMSNSVRHGRSFSDKASRMSKDAKSIKSSGAGLQDAFEDRDDVTWLKNELRKERQRSLEKDQKIAELEAALNAQAEVKQANSELKEKRSTMVVLDAKKEVVMRELAVLTEQLEKEKQGGGPMDLAKLTNSVVREFAERLNQLKESFAPEIEKLMKERSQMQEELEKLARMKDKSFSEFEQLSSKNAQLAELNNQLVHQIQELYKANSGLEGSRPNGLGIHSHSKEKSVGSVEVKTGDLASSGSSMAIHDEAEPATIVPGPQVVSIRKGQPRKFNWKRGGQNVAKGVTKGIKGAFSSERESSSTQNQNGNKEESGTSSTTQKSQTQDPGRGFSNLFGNQKRPAPWKSQQQNGNSNSSAQTDNAEKPAEGLFGVDLEQRLEQEKSIIPAIVTRCIQEVELRGMDQEGIYRKSGASSVTQSIRDGFERANDFDISDPDLDIHAVTSALKQYFRKLPTPLITYEVYDKVLETNDIISHSSRVEAVRNSLEGLPKSHRDVLEFLVFHLKRVVEHEKENLMSSQNIAVVFAPTIMRPESIAREMTDVQRKNEALKFIVENCQEIFM